MSRLDAERWRTISPYLDEALDLPTEQRGEWLAAICARDPRLGADLQALLAEQGAVDESRFLERPARGCQRRPREG